VLNREGKDVFSDEENGPESVKVAKRLIRERERERRLSRRRQRDAARQQQGE